VLGADPPGISTAVQAGVAPGDTVAFNVPEAWLDMPVFVTPALPAADASLDTVSSQPFDGRIAWNAVTRPRTPDLHVVRINYMTGAPVNMMVSDEASGRQGSVGGSRSHCLWELILLSDQTSLDLPTFPAEATVRPDLRNPASALDDTSTPYHYAENTLEIELNAYLLGADDKPFDAGKNFLYQDFNLHSSAVSQDSVLATFP